MINIEHCLHRATFLFLLILLPLFLAFGCSTAEPDIRTQIARDINFRMDKDFFNDGSEAKNVATILSDCEFEETDLTGTGTKAVVVKLNWFPDGRFGFAKGRDKNFIRGVQDNGHYYVYAIHDKKPVFLGIIYGNEWQTVPAGGGSDFLGFETSSHAAADKAIVNNYWFMGGEYILISSILYQYDNDGNRKQLEVFKPEPAPAK